MIPSRNPTVVKPPKKTKSAFNKGPTSHPTTPTKVLQRQKNRGLGGQGRALLPFHLVFIHIVQGLLQLSIIFLDVIGWIWGVLEKKSPMSQEFGTCVIGNGSYNKCVITPKFKWLIINVLYYIPGTQMTLVFIGKGLVLEG